MKRLIIYSLFGLCLTFISSCGCNYHLKKARGKCGYTSDTVYKTIEVVVDKVETDTVFKHSYTSKDTVIIKEGRLTMKYFYNTHDSTVYLTGKCDTVKVPVNVPVVVHKYKMSLPWWVIALKWMLFVLAAIVGGGYLYTKIRGRIRV